MIWIDGRYEGAHRVAWFMAHGEWPDEWFVCHTCDNGHCVNYQHLLLGSAKQNKQHSVMRGRTLAGAANPAAKHVEKYPEIHKLRASGMELSVISAQTGVSMTQLKRILPASRKVVSDDNVMRIKEMHREGFSFADIGRNFGIHASTASRIARGLRHA